MIFRDLNNVEAKEIIKGFNAKFVHSENVTVQFVDIRKGSKAPEHSHPESEQISTVTSGEFELTVARETKVLKPGVSAVIPFGVKHSGQALTDCKAIDIFYPIREDLKK